MYKRKSIIAIILIIQILLVNVSVFSNEGYKYKEQLSISQKEIYERFVKEVKIGNTYVDITDIYANTVYTKEEMEHLGEKIAKDTQIVIDAFTKDYPEIYWLKFGEGGVGTSYSYETIGSLSEIKEVTFKIAVADRYRHNLEEVDKELKEKIKNFKVEGSTRYDKVKSIHDSLISMITYESGHTYAHEPIGSFIYGKAVCEGYAKAFKLLCDREGIPSVLVTGIGITTENRQEPHMWNYVLMEDNKWYGVDVTWDDQGKAYHDFFLVGSETRDQHFGKKKFSESHIPEGDFSGTRIFEFTYPPLSKTSYVPLVTTPEPTPIKTPIPTPTPTNTPTPSITITPTLEATEVPTTPVETYEGKSVEDTLSPSPDGRETEVVESMEPDEPKGDSYIGVIIIAGLISSFASILIILVVIQKRK